MLRLRTRSLNPVSRPLISSSAAFLLLRTYHALSQIQGASREEISLLVRLTFLVEATTLATLALPFRPLLPSAYRCCSRANKR